MAFPVNQRRIKTTTKPPETRGAEGAVGNTRQMDGAEGAVGNTRQMIGAQGAVSSVWMEPCVGGLKIAVERELDACGLRDQRMVGE